MTGAGIGLVGLGRWGTVWAKALERAAIPCPFAFDRNPDAVEEFHGRGLTRLATSSGPSPELIRKATAIVVATPPDTHLGVLRWLADRGARRVLIEKPLAPSVEEARAIVDIARARGTEVLTGHTFLHSYPVVHARGLVREHLSRVDAFAARWLQPGTGREEDALWNLGPHPFSILQRFVSGEEPTDVSATALDPRGSGLRDWWSVQMRFPSGTIADVELSHVHPEKVRAFEVVGPEGTVLCRPTQGEVIWAPSQGEMEIEHRMGVEPLVELANFLTSAPPEAVASGGRDGLWNVRLLAAAEAAAGASVREVAP